MLYKAVKNFTGLITMNVGQVKDITDEYIAKDLLNAKYIEPVEEKKKTTKKG